ncbi:hypothetical protein CEV34_0832 [Brucella pseudogrignonensis]|uniref:Uncharacterized protein n=1 Tax=Brucella pseudogrignonensis TaxID=419475 RepID=A0A256GQ71_9HYPH|nr:hypothetical protein CEV34_0832 [Brucella pseudogrignonensis]
MLTGNGGTGPQHRRSMPDLSGKAGHPAAQAALVFLWQ